MHLVPNEQFAAVTGRKSQERTRSMQPDSLRQVRSHAGIERAISLIGHDVNSLLLHTVVIARSVATKQSRRRAGLLRRRWNLTAALDCFASLAMTVNSPCWPCARRRRVRC